MTEERNYFREMNNHLIRYKIKITNRDDQELLMNYEIRQLHLFVGDKFNELWTYLLDLLRNRLERTHYKPHDAATLIAYEGVERIQIFDITYHLIWSRLKELERRNILMVEYEEKHFISNKKYKSKRNKYRKFNVIFHRQECKIKKGIRL